MCSIFRPNLRQALNLNVLDTSLCIFGGTSNVVKNLKENKEINTLVKSSHLQTKKVGKAGGKSGQNKGKKPAAGVSKAKGKKGSKKKTSKKEAKKSSGNSKEKEDSKEKEKNDQCKLVTQESITSCHPSSPGLCGCRASFDNTVSSIPRGADWTVSFP